MSRRPYLFDARSAAWQRTTGWERYTRELARRLTSSDSPVDVRTTGSEKIASRLWQDLIATPAAARDYRVVHFPSFPPVPWTPPRATVVYTLHDLTWWRHRATSSGMGRHYYRRLARRAVASQVHLVTDTQTVKDELIADFAVPPERVTVVPLGVGLPAPDPAEVEDLRRGRPFLLTVATLEPRKNLARLVDAYALSGLGRTHDLVVIGRAAWGTPVSGLHVMSGLSDQRLVAMYAAASAVVLPSLYEGFGLPAAEAMQIGTRVVCSDLPVLREVTGGRAIYVDPLDVRSMADGLQAVLAAPEDDEPAVWARRTWDWDRSARALTSLYRTLDGAAP